MTHAHTQVTHTNYNHLAPDTQEQFDQTMQRADNSATTGEYLALMVVAALTVGIDLHYGGELRKCGCSCYCPTVFITRPDTHVIEYGQGYNLGRVQCDLCADRHRETA
jgi:hypothetical protein